MVNMHYGCLDYKIKHGYRYKDAFVTAFRNTGIIETVTHLQLLNRDKQLTIAFQDIGINSL